MSTKLIIQLILAFLLGGARGFEQERARQAALVAQGVKEQIEAQDAWDRFEAERAKALKEASDRASDADVDADIDSLVRPASSVSERGAGG